MLLLNTIAGGFDGGRRDYSTQRRYVFQILTMYDLTKDPKEGETKSLKVEISYLEKDAHNDDPMVSLLGVMTKKLEESW